MTRLLTAQQKNKFDEVLEIIQVYCESDTTFKLQGKLKAHLRGNSRSARMFIDMTRLFDTARRIPSIVTFVKVLENNEARRTFPTPPEGGSNTRPMRVTKATLMMRLDEAARQVARMMEYLTSTEDAVDLHTHMTQHINRVHADNIVLGSANRADARMIVEPVREWWMIMADSTATAVLNNSALCTLRLIPTEVHEVLEHLVKAVRNLLAHNRISHPTNSTPTSDDVATLSNLPRFGIGVALTSAEPGETFQTDLYTDIAYHDIIRETNRKLRAAKLSTIIQRARSSLSADGDSDSSPSSAAGVTGAA